MFSINRFDATEEEVNEPVDATPSHHNHKHKAVEALLARVEKRFKADAPSPSPSSLQPQTSAAPSILRSLDQLRGRHAPRKSPSDLGKPQPQPKAKPERSGLLKSAGEDLEEDQEIEAFKAKWGLAGWLVVNLRNGLGIRKFFGIQRRAIPVFMRSQRRDVCIFAPTGSGKTLAFAVPIIQELSSRIVPRTRALVLLPTRELAQQVFVVFQSCCKGSSLSVRCMTGSVSFEQEQRKLTQAPETDVVVATPGRLLEHIKHTPGFTLQHLRFLVIDEADRLLSQSYHGWLAAVLEAASKPPSSVADGKQLVRCRERVGIGIGIGKLLPGTLRSGAENALGVREEEEVRLCKILCSATLTPDPQKFAAMRLERAIYVTEAHGEMSFDADVEIGSKFVLPDALEMHMWMCTRANKPLALIQLLKSLVEKNERSLVFTRSVEATHRLYMLLSMVNKEDNAGLHVAELSSSQDAKTRSKILAKLAAKDVLVCICSDVIARGIDILGLENVINYDAPLYVKTLVHRAGRTARAGKGGRCYSLVHSDQGRHFRQLLRDVGRKPVYTKVDNEKLDVYRASYETCLAKMKKVAKRG